MKICFKMNKVLDFSLHCKFWTIWTCFGDIVRKTKNNFPRLYSWSSLCCHYGTSNISNILLHHQTFFPRKPEISVRWFLLKSVLKRVWAQGWQGKRKQRGTILLRYQPSNLLKSWTNGSGSEEQCVIYQIYFPIIIGATHTNFQMFLQWTRTQFS